QRIAKLEHPPHFDECGCPKAPVEIVGDGHGGERLQNVSSGAGTPVIHRRSVVVEWSWLLSSCPYPNGYNSWRRSASPCTGRALRRRTSRSSLFPYRRTWVS